jgi:hypothetical protein
VEHDDRPRSQLADHRGHNLVDPRMRPIPRVHRPQDQLQPPGGQQVPPLLVELGKRSGPAVPSRCDLRSHGRDH